MPTHTRGEMSTPATGGMTARVGLSSGSVGMAAIDHGNSFKSYLGNHERTTRIRKRIVPIVSRGPSTSFVGAIHETSLALTGSTRATEAIRAEASAAFGAAWMVGRGRLVVSTPLVGGVPIRKEAACCRRSRRRRDRITSATAGRRRGGEGRLAFGRERVRAAGYARQGGGERRDAAR